MKRKDNESFEAYRKRRRNEGILIAAKLRPRIIIPGRIIDPLQKKMKKLEKKFDQTPEKAIITRARLLRMAEKVQARIEGRK